VFRYVNVGKFVLTHFIGVKLSHRNVVAEAVIPGDMVRILHSKVPNAYTMLPATMRPGRLQDAYPSCA
jgi:hypothetical protein